MITKFNFKDRTIKSYAIRKLTPFECFRLMGVRDATIHIMQSTIGWLKSKLKGNNATNLVEINPYKDKTEDGKPTKELLKRLKNVEHGTFVEFVRQYENSEGENYYYGKKFQDGDKYYYEWYSGYEWMQHHKADPEAYPMSDDRTVTEPLVWVPEALYIGIFDHWDHSIQPWLDVEASDESREFVYCKSRLYREYASVEVSAKDIKGKDDEMVISASQQYKQAGNSIVVDVLAAIYEQLWYPKPRKPKQQLDMFDTLFADEALPEYTKEQTLSPAYGSPSPVKGRGCAVTNGSSQADNSNQSPLPLTGGAGGGSVEKIILTTFSGYDSQLMACDALREHHPDFRWTCAGWSDIDKYACQMHDLIFPEYADRSLGDITKIDWHKVRETLAGREIDLFTYSSPCQDISQAGKQMGLKEGSGSRSALLWNVADAVEILRPKYLLQENVAALVSEKFMPDFQKWIDRLKSLGYVTRWALLNAKDYGVPQNRLRVFAISMRQDCAFDYQFPAPMPLEKRLEDILQPEVDEKYFLKDDAVSKFLKANDKDHALFHQFALPPTHEDAMFLKTWLQLLMNLKGDELHIKDGDWTQKQFTTLWDASPTVVEQIIQRDEQRFYMEYDQWKKTGEMPGYKGFEEMFEENMKNSKVFNDIRTTLD